MPQPDAQPYTVELFYQLVKYGQTHDHIEVKRFPTADLARDFRVTALRTIGQWPPRGAINAEVGDLNGPDIRYEWPNRDRFMAGIAQVREALANCDGPLVADLARAAKVSKPKTIEQQRVAS